MRSSHDNIQDFAGKAETVIQSLELTVKSGVPSNCVVYSFGFFTVSFYRDLLPFTLKLPQAILEASSFQDLEIISSLGIGKSLKAARVSLKLVRTVVLHNWRIDELLSSE